MWKYIYILSACILSAFPGVHAQTSHINFTSLSTKDGLLSNSVNAIIKDRNGLMWFATDDGLNKFDGTNFTIYRHLPGDSASLRSNEIISLHEDKRGNLWIGTSGGGLSLYNRQKDIFSHFPVTNTIVEGFTGSAVIRGICSDNQGKIWIAQFEGLYVLDPVSKTITKQILRDAAGRPVKTTLTGILKDSKEKLWIVTDSGLFVYDLKTNSFRLHDRQNTDAFGPPSNKFKAVAEDKWGNIWVATGNRLSQLKPGGSNFIHVDDFIRAEINCITGDDQGQLWIGTNNGLYVYNIQTNAHTLYNHEYGNTLSLNGNWIRCAYIDRQGIYWFGMHRGGISKYDKNLNLFDLTLSSSFQEQRSNIAVISAMVINRNGRVLIGTDGNGLYELDRSTHAINPVSLRLKDLSARSLPVLALHRTQTGKLYIGTYAYGLLIADQQTGATKRLVKGPGVNDLSGNDIFCIQEDSKGLIWIGTNGDGLTVLKDDRVVAKYRPAPTSAGEALLPINGYIRAIEEDADGNIWVGTHGGGIAIFEPASGKWTIYNQENSQLPANKIQCLHRDSKGRMWIGTFGGGLAEFDQHKHQFRFFTEKDGLANTMIYQILEDDNGSLWISTNTGISSFDAGTNTFRNFTAHNGLQHSNFVRGSGIRLPDGALIFAGLQGFNFIYPGKLTVNNNVPQVILTDLKISNKSVVPGTDAPIEDHISVATEIRLDYKQNFALNFVALNYTIPKQNHYAYKLDGFDKDWNNTGTANTASYTNLDPGEYVFRVKASNNDGVWSAKDTTIKIYVQPPFWRTPSAYVFYILAIAGLLVYSRHRVTSKLHKKFALQQERQEVERMQELDRLKLKFLTNLSHDFRTPISLIMGPVDQLMEAEGSPGKLEKLGMIRRNARRLLNLVNQLLDFRKMEEHELKLQLSKGEFISFLKEVTESFRDLSERKQIHFTFNSCIDRLDALFDRDKIERILFNLLSNAFKFTLAGGHIAVDLLKAERSEDEEYTSVTIAVKDSGIGIPDNKKELIFDRFFQHHTTAAVLNQGSGIGLSITAAFIELHGGVIEVESEPGKGSTFTFRIPLKRSIEPAPEEQPVPLPRAPAYETTHSTAEAPAAPPAGTTHDALSVLLVEDNEDFRFYLKDNLKNNYRVIEAANGMEGWQKALASHPQLIVSDISMPEMDGIALIKKLKSDKRTSHIPVILLTAMTGQEQQIKGLETGANDYITKPFNFEILNAKIKNLLDLNSTMRSTYSKQIKIAAPEASIESSDEKLLQQIVSYLEKNLADSQLSVESLSKQIGMSRGTLYAKLLALTGQTPVEYIRSFRLEKAAILMEKSNMTIAEIAYQVGFTTPNYFAKSFKSRYHMLPSEFIAKVRKA